MTRSIVKWALGLMLAMCFSLLFVSCGGGGGVITPRVNPGSPGSDTQSPGSIVSSDLTPGSIVDDPTSGKKIVAQQVIVQFRPNQPASDINTLLEQNQLSVVGQNSIVGIYQLQITDGSSLETIMSRLNSSGKIQRLSKNFVMNPDSRPNDPAFRDPGDARAWALEKIKAFDAWALVPSPGSPLVAVLDTGVESNHIELRGRVVTGTSFVSDPADTEDRHGHGTFVAGLIAAAVNNGQGAAGVCPTARILPVKVCDNNGNCPLFAIINGISYAAGQGADVINISLGAEFTEDLGVKSLFEAAVALARQQDSLVIAAAGNENHDTALFLPAAATGVLAIGATDPDDNRASFSNFGTKVALSAPGKDVYSLALNNEFRTSSGTSDAAAVVSGAAAEILAAKAGLSASNLETVLLGAIDPIETDFPLGAGRLNLLSALEVGTTMNIAPEIVSLVPDKRSLLPGGIAVITLTASDADGDILNIAWSAQSGALSAETGATVSWTAPLTTGEYAIMVTVSDGKGGTDTDSVVIVVNPAVLERIDVSPATMSLGMGSRVQFSATGFFSDGSSSVLTNAVVWGVSNSSLAEIDSRGMFKALNAGTVNVIGALDGKTGQAVITITGYGGVDDINLGVADFSHTEVANRDIWPMFLNDRYHTRKSLDIPGTDTIPANLPFVLYWKMDLRQAGDDPVFATPVIYDDAIWITSSLMYAYKIKPTGIPNALLDSHNFGASLYLSGTSVAPYGLGFGASKPNGQGGDLAGYYWNLPGKGFYAMDNNFDLKWSVVGLGSTASVTVAAVPNISNVDAVALVSDANTKELIAYDTDGFYPGSDFIVMAQDPNGTVPIVADPADIQSVPMGQVADLNQVVITAGSDGTLQTNPTGGVNCSTFGAQGPCEAAPVCWWDGDGSQCYPRLERWVADRGNPVPCTSGECNSASLDRVNDGYTGESGNIVAAGRDVVWKCNINTRGFASPTVVQVGAKWYVLYPDSSDNNDALSAFDLDGFDLTGKLDGTNDGLIDTGPNAIESYDTGCDIIWRYHSGVAPDLVNANIAASPAVYGGRVFFGTQQGAVAQNDSWSLGAPSTNPDDGYFHAVDITTGFNSARSSLLQVCADNSPAVGAIGGSEWVYTGTGTLRGGEFSEFYNLFCLDIAGGDYFGFHAWQGFAGTDTGPTWEFKLKKHNYKNFFMSPPLILNDNIVLVGGGDGVFYAFKTTGYGGSDVDCDGTACPGDNNFGTPGAFADPEWRCTNDAANCALGGTDILWAYAFANPTAPVGSKATIDNAGDVMGAPAAYNNLIYIGSATGFLYAFGEAPTKVTDIDISRNGANLDVDWTNPTSPVDPYYFHGVMIVRKNAARFTTQLANETTVKQSDLNPPSAAIYRLGDCIQTVDHSCTGDPNQDEKIVFISTTDGSGNPPPTGDWVTSTGAGAAQTYEDTDVTGGTQYCYRIYTIAPYLTLSNAGAQTAKLFNYSWIPSTGDALGADDDCETAGLPAAPTGVAATDSLHDLGLRLDLTWNKSVDDPSGMDNYEIRRGTVANGAIPCDGAVTYGTVLPLVPVTGAATYTYVDTGLVNGTYYCYAVYSEADGVYSDPPDYSDTAVTPENNTPAPPTLPTAADNLLDDGEQINLAWTLSVDDATIKVSNYWIYRNDDVGMGADCTSEAYAATIASVATGTTAYNDTTTVDGTYYCYAVAAIDIHGVPATLVSTKATIALAVTSVNDTPDPPLTLTAADTPLDTGGSIDLSWPLSVDDPNDGPGDDSVDDYWIYRVVADAGESSDCTDQTYGGVMLTRPAGTTTYVDNTTVDETYYCYAIRAVDTDGNPDELVSAWTYSSPTASGDNRPAAPPSITATDAPYDNGTQLDIAWAKSDDDPSGDYSYVEQYNVEFVNVGPIEPMDCDSQGGYGFLATTLAGELTATHAPIIKDNYYCYRVQAANAFLVSAWTYSAPTAPRDNRPAAPAWITATDAPDDDGNQLDIAWAISDDDPSGDYSYVEQYNVEFADVGLGGVNCPDVDPLDYESLAATLAGELTATHAPITQDNYYCYRVKAANAFMESEDWTYSTPAAPADNMAYPPASLTVDQPACPEIRVTWDKAPDDDGLEVVQYHVYRSGADSPTFPADFVEVRLEPATGAATYIWTDGPDPGDGTWYYTVTSEDESGNISAHFTPIPSFESTCHSYHPGTGEYDFGPSFHVFGTGGAPGQNNLPVGAAIDEATSRIYVTDTGNWRLQVYDLAAGTFLGQFGTSGTGGTLAPGGGGKWNAPMGLYFNNGKLWVANNGNKRIEWCTSTGSCTIDLLMTAAPACKPWDVALDTAGTFMYVVCRDINAVRKYAVGGSATRTYTAQRTINGATGIEYYNNQLYVTSINSDDIQILNDDGTLLSVAGTMGIPGTGDGELTDPWGIRLDINDLTGLRLFVVSDSGNNRVQVFDENGVFKTKFGSYGVCTGDPTSCEGKLNGPAGLAIRAHTGNPVGDAYIVDRGNSRVALFLGPANP